MKLWNFIGLSALIGQLKKTVKDQSKLEEDQKVGLSTFVHLFSSKTKNGNFMKLCMKLRGQY